MDLLQMAESKVGQLIFKSNGAKGKEFAGACPECGGSDRFLIWPDAQMPKCTGKYWCRSCGIADDSIGFYRKYIDPAASFDDTLAALKLDNTNLLRVKNIPKVKDAPPLKMPSSLWIEKATKFVEWCHRELWKHPDVIKWLNNEGVSVEIIKKYKIGYNPIEKDQFCKLVDWGIVPDEKNLKVAQEKDKDPVFVIKKQQIIIPVFDRVDGKQVIVKIKLRDRYWTEASASSKYAHIKGGMIGGLAHIGNKDNIQHCVVVVESELDAYEIETAAGDLVFIVATGGCKNPIDSISKRYANKTENLIVIPDNPKNNNDTSGKDMFNKWNEVAAGKAKSCPVPISLGKDIRKAKCNGLDIREFVLSALPKKQVVAPDINAINAVEISQSRVENAENLSPITPIRLNLINGIPKVFFRDIDHAPRDGQTYITINSMLIKFVNGIWLTLDNNSWQQYKSV